MIKRPWQIWGLFLTAVLFAFAALCWLTSKSLELENSRKAAREQAELAWREAAKQQRLSRALSRLDWVLTPLIGQEATRPYYYYNSFLPDSAPAKSKVPTLEWLVRSASPILVQPSEFIRLHFQISADGTWSSPQVPKAEDLEKALLSQCTPELIKDNETRLADLESRLSQEMVRSLAPETFLASATIKFPLDRNYSLDFRSRRQAEPQLLLNTTNVPAGDDYLQRNRSTQNFLQSQRAFNSGEPDFQPPESEQKLVQEGVATVAWLDSELVLLRRIRIGEQELIQGCWFEWDRLKESLLEEIAEIAPNVDLCPVDPGAEVAPGRLLATIPVQLVPRALAIASNPLAGNSDASTETAQLRWGRESPLGFVLAIAWIGFGLATCSIGLLLAGVIRLSERRASFVSAVTHELRTPLTTFRLYTELLANDMIGTAEKRQQYCETLHCEAERLSHLVENVLQFAKLEGNPHQQRWESIQLGDLIDRLNPRLQQRAEQANMTLRWEVEPPIRKQNLTTSSSAIEHILYNLVDNACKYASRGDCREIEIGWQSDARGWVCSVRDHGPGITREQAKRIFRPFSKSAEAAAGSAPGVGLGLSLCRRLARDLGGSLTLSQPASQSAVEFRLSDRECEPKCERADRLGNTRPSRGLRLARYPKLGRCQRLRSCSTRT
jgi:signal transduction histidine kinase